MTSPPNPPGLELLQRCQAGFLLQGTTLNRWARQNGMEPMFLRHAITGSSNGPKSQRMRAKAVAAAKLEQLATSQEAA